MKAKTKLHSRRISRAVVARYRSSSVSLSCRGIKRRKHMHVCRRRTTRSRFLAPRPLYVRVLVGVGDVACNFVRETDALINRPSAQYTVISHVPFGKEE